MEQTGKLSVYESIFCENGINFHGIELFYFMKPKGTREGLVCKSHGMDGAKEYLYWIPLNEMANTKLFPEFFKTRLYSLPFGIEMIRTTLNSAKPQ